MWQITPRSHKTCELRSSVTINNKPWVDSTHPWLIINLICIDFFRGQSSSCITSSYTIILLPESTDKFFNGSYTNKPVPFLSSCFSTRKWQRKSLRREQDHQRQAFQNTTHQWKCFWHSVKQVQGIFYRYLCKARGCCQNCPLCNSSAQLRKIKSSRELICHVLRCARDHHWKVLILTCH